MKKIFYGLLALALINTISDINARNSRKNFGSNAYRYHMETDVAVKERVTPAKQEMARQQAKLAQDKEDADVAFQQEVTTKKTRPGRKEDTVLDDGSIVPNFNEAAYAEQMKKVCAALVEKASKFLMANDEDITFNAINNNPDFSDGDIYVFVLNKQGVVLAHGAENQLIWQNMYNYKDIYGTFVVRAILEKASKGGGWMTYQWRNATKISYVKEVKKGDTTYILGAGYYPHSKRDATVALVRSAVEYFNNRIKVGEGGRDAFSKFSYPLGSFELGGLYLYALDFDGNIVAQGDRPGLIGQNALNYKDANGKETNKEIIEKLKTATGGVWVEYQSKRAKKVAYAEKVTDEKGKNYFIACGYYPDADRRQTVDLVRQGFRYMEGQGKTIAAQEFSSKTSDAFRYGDLYLTVYDPHGITIANGNDPDLIGSNQWDVKDDNGKYMVREIIKKAEDEGGWVDFHLRNAYYFVYCELVHLGKDDYIICSGLFPISKPETMQMLVKSAVSLLADNPREKIFAEMVRRDGRFIRGDLEVFVFDARGICYAYGDEVEKIWTNMLKAKDQDGRAFVQNVINTAKRGPGRVSYRMNGKQKVAYVEPFQKGNVFYAVGSSFYLS